MTIGPASRRLDALARWTVRHEVASESSSLAADTEAGTNDPNPSRRTFLQRATAAVVLSSFSRLLFAERAFADTPGCVKGAEKFSIEKFKFCVDKPLEALETWGKAFDTASEALGRTTSRTSRARLLKIIDDASKGRARAGRQLEKCNFQFIEDRAQSYFNCNNKAAPFDAATGVTGPTGDSGGCPPLTYRCTGGGELQCCFDGTYCCICGVCCVYSDCRCC